MRVNLNLIQVSKQIIHRLIRLLFLCNLHVHMRVSVLVRKCTYHLKMFEDEEEKKRLRTIKKYDLNETWDY